MTLSVDFRFFDPNTSNEKIAKVIGENIKVEGCQFLHKGKCVAARINNSIIRIFSLEKNDGIAIRLKSLATEASAIA